METESCPRWLYKMYIQNIGYIQIYNVTEILLSCYYDGEYVIAASK